MTINEIIMKLAADPSIALAKNLFPGEEHIPSYVPGLGNCRVYTIAVYCPISPQPKTEETTTALDEAFARLETPPDLNVRVGEQLGVKMKRG